jgi:hypothetical protein
LRDRHRHGVDAKLAVRPEHAGALDPDGLQVIEVGLVRRRARLTLG